MRVNFLFRIGSEGAHSVVRLGSKTYICFRTGTGVLADGWDMKRGQRV